MASLFGSMAPGSPPVSEDVIRAVMARLPRQPLAGPPLSRAEVQETLHGSPESNLSRPLTRDIAANPEYNPGAMDFAMSLMGGRLLRGFHGSPNTLQGPFRPSERGRFGPGVYATEQEAVSGRYGTPHAVNIHGDLFNAMPGWNSLSKEAEAKIIAQLTPAQAAKLAKSKDWYKGDAEAFWESLRRVEGDEVAVKAIERAGFSGIRGIGDGGEINVFSPSNIARDPTGIRAYHGSPHDFDKFSLAHIGKGEGAQAYGHGLYFAENEGVARSYRDKLSPIKPITNDAGTFDQAAILQALDREENAVFAAAKRLGGWDKAIAQVQQQRAAAGSPETRAAADRLIAAADRIKGHIPIEPGGRMYEVNINARPEQFLDWDKPLSGQSRGVREALGVTPEVEQALTQHLSSGRARNAYDPALWGKMRLVDDDPTGSSIVRRFAEAKRGGYTEYDYPIASERLRDAGIPGIRYLDQGSRTAGQGSSNYVVFDDSLIDILRKYALPGIPAAGALGAAASSDGPAFGSLAP